MGRSRVVVVGVACVLGLLSGCTPADLPLVAVWLRSDGEPLARLQPCGGGHVTQVSLRSWGEGREEQEPDGDGAWPSEDPDSGWHMWESVNIGRTTFRLFAPPPSWHVETTGTQALRPGRTYALSFHGPRGGDPYDGHVYFTQRDLESLAPGQVWADGRPMSGDAFRELADEMC